MEQRGRDRRDAAGAWIIVVAVQGMFGMWLVHLPLPFATDGTDDALVVEFIRRPVRAANVSSRPAKPLQVSTAAQPIRAAHVERNAAAAESTAQPLADGLPPTRPLDLSPPPPELPQPIGRRQPFERPPPMQARRTRFADAWMPEGDALRQASFRSVAVKAALGAFGGPPRRCSEIERRLRKLNCLQLHGQEEEDEALRRSLGP